MSTIPTTWTTIAYYSANDGRYVATPGAVCTESAAMLTERVERRTIRMAGRELLQVRRVG